MQSIGSKIYVMTRDFYLVDSQAVEYEDKEATYLLFVYDTETQTWSVDQNLASKDCVPCVSMAASGEHLYLISSDGVMYLTPGGAFDGDFAFQEYAAMEALGKDAAEWTSVTELPVVLNENQEYIAASAVSDGKIIISGLRANDTQDSGVVPDTYIYDSTSNSWSIAEKQLAPHKITGAQGIIADDGYFYVLGTDSQDAGSLLTVKRCKVSDSFESSEDPDNPKDPEESDEPKEEESENPNGGASGEVVTPDGNPTSDTGEKDALPQHRIRCVTTPKHWLL